MTGTKEGLFAVAATTVPGTDPRELAQILADGLVLFRVPAAALITEVPVSASIERQVRGYAESLEVAEAAADWAVFLVRLYYRDGDRPDELLEIAIAVRELWQRHATGTASGLVGVTVLPPMTPGQWLKAAQGAQWVVATTNAHPGLLPG